MGILGKIFQVLVDIIIGIAIYFGLNAFMPELNDNLVVVVALIVTAIFAEFAELKFKK